MTISCYQRDNTEEEEEDSEDDDINELDELSENEQVQVPENTAEVCEIVTKVSYMKQKIQQLLFAIIHSTTITLPAWCHTCLELNLKKRLIPRDVVT